VVRLLALVVILMAGCVSPNISRPKPQRQATDWSNRSLPVMYVWEDVYYGHVDPEYDPEEEE